MFSLLKKNIPSLISVDEKRLSATAYAFLALLCLAFFAPGFATMPPTDRDEALFAQASKQMVETGNYIDIRVQNEPRYKKPIGIYWLQSTSARLLSAENLNEIWAYRLPSLLGAIIAVLMTAALGALFFSPATGLVAGVLMAGCVLLNVEARLAKTDAALLASVMVAMYGLGKAYLGRASVWGTPLLFWSAIAAGVLIKGPLILLPIGGALLWTYFSYKDLSWVRALNPAWGIPYALILIAPWFVAINMQSHGAFMEQSAGNDMLAKLWQGQNRGMIPPGAHFMALPVLLFPYSLFVLLSLPDVWKNRRDRAIRFFLGWIIPTWIVFEISLTKLPHYVLPIYPAIAIFTAKYLLDGFPTLTSAVKHRVPLALIALLWLMIGGGFAFVFGALPWISDQVRQEPQILAGWSLLLIQVGALIVFFKNKLSSFALVTVGGFVFLSVTFGVTLPSLQNVWLSRQIVETAERIKPCAEAAVVAVGYREPSLVFMAGTKTLLAKSGDDAADALKQDACRVAFVSDKHKERFIAAFQEEAPPREVKVLQGLNIGKGAPIRLIVFVNSSAP